MKRKFISATQAAKIAGVTTMTIRNLCKSKVITFKKKRKLFYPLEEDILKYAEDIYEIFEAANDIEEVKTDILKEKEVLKQEKERVSKYLEATCMRPSRIRTVYKVSSELVSKLSDEFFSTKELKVVEYLLRGCNNSISDFNNVSHQRVGQIFNNFLDKLSSYNDYQSKVNERVKNMEEIISEQNFTITKLKNIIDELESKIPNTDFKYNDDLYVLLNKRMVDFDISIRALNCLKAAEIDTLGELVRHKRSDLLKYRNFGKKSLTELDELLERHGLAFGMELIEYHRYESHLINSRMLDE